MVPHTSYTHSCMINSMNGTSMNLSAYSIDSHGDDGAYIASFVVFNPGPGDEYGIRNISVEDDASWHSCGDSPHSLPWQLRSCQYLLDQANNKIGFQLEWDCDDRDPYNAYVTTHDCSISRSKLKISPDANSSITVLYSAQRQTGNWTRAPRVRCLKYHISTGQ